MQQGTTQHLPASGLPVGPDGLAEGEPPQTRPPAPGPGELAAALATAALDLGFSRVGFAPVEPFARGKRALESWLARGLHGEMSYLADGGQRADPSSLLAGARTLIVAALAYPGSRSETVPLRTQSGRLLCGTVARYARGADYHLLLKERLHALADRAATLVARPVLARACVDTAPLLEREAAARAGVGFQAKNTLVIAPGLGSFVLLGELLLDVEVAPSAPLEPRCGSCRACLDACPTGAFVDAHVLDARRCISYLTIEYSGVIPLELRPAIGTRVFGCDVCQEVCPFKRLGGAASECAGVPGAARARSGRPRTAARARFRQLPQVRQALGAEPRQPSDPGAQRRHRARQQPECGGRSPARACARWPPLCHRPRARCLGAGRARFSAG